MRSIRPVVVTCAVVIMMATSCGTSGRELTTPDGTVTPVPTVGVVANLADGPGGMAIRGVAFQPGDVVDPGLTGVDGEPPDIVWTHIPAGTAELALIARDADAAPDERVRWAVAGLPPRSAGIRTGALPAGAFEVERPDGVTTWAGVSTTGHRVQFVLCALPGPVPADIDVAGLQDRCDTNPIGVASVAVIVGGS
ncbi:MAG: hypothetical protein RIE08_12380 [Acidimicrobiales bacterium]